MAALSAPSNRCSHRTIVVWCTPTPSPSHGRLKFCPASSRRNKQMESADPSRPSVLKNQQLARGSSQHTLFVASGAPADIEVFVQLARTNHGRRARPTSSSQTYIARKRWLAYDAPLQLTSLPKNACCFQNGQRRKAVISWSHESSHVANPPKGSYLKHKKEEGPG